MGSLTAFEWMSADGVFDASSMDQWWEPYDSQSRQKSIIETYENVDAFLMGRTTHDLLGPYWSQLPDQAMGGVAGRLTHTPKFVVSRDLPETYWPNTVHVNEYLDATVKQLKGQYAQIVIIGSAALVESLCLFGLVDEFKFLIQPKIMGVGSRFFRERTQASLEILSSERLENDVQFVHYAVRK